MHVHVGCCFSVDCTQVGVGGRVGEEAGGLEFCMCRGGGGPMPTHAHGHSMGRGGCMARGGEGRKQRVSHFNGARPA